MLIASLLSAEEIEYDNVPDLADVNITCQLLESFGAKISRTSNHSLKISVPSLIATEASYALVKSIRASFWILGPLLARGGAARVALPGGDIIGARPVNMHLDALTQMGADIKIKNGVVFATAQAGLKPQDIKFDFPSVGATHQVLLAASLTEGVSTITGAAREPEVIALAELLNQMGAEISGAGESKITIKGKSSLGSAKVSLIGDRIEAASYLLSAAVTQSKLKVEGFNPKHLGGFLDIMDEIGMNPEIGEDFVQVDVKSRIKAIEVETSPFPGLATDIQAPLMAALCYADGKSIINETIFEGRFGHVSELCRMGAKIKVKGNLAIIEGVENLVGAPVQANDIRAAAALLIAALSAEGKTTVSEVHHFKRGYERIDEKFNSLGANVHFVPEDAEDYILTGC
ncbi:UNVERIFIED_CONTAM: hypothetical protein GTU68_024550 [Idotea baltica]|nr:hypothetical protein [Idotea baltica]